MLPIPTRLMTADALPEAVRLLTAGELVAFPTETVYGLGADARSDAAVRKIYEAKGRPSGNPVIVHVATPAEARDYAAVGGWPALAEALARRFWPGPLTMIVPRGERLSPLVSAGRQTVALRCPAHPVAHALLAAFKGPVAAPSANCSGFTSPTTAAHVMAELNGRIPLVIDGGPSHHGVESTVLDLSADIPTILRPGSITLEMLREVAPQVRQVSQVVGTQESAASPGLHSRHYAPRTPAYRFPREAWGTGMRYAANHSPVAILTWADDCALAAPHHTLRLSADAAEYARSFYAALRDADTLEARAILVLEPPDPTGVWAAVADRMRRATLLLPTSAGESGR